ncbi:unnamed protein product [Protopolystoma xenopodis]|uniref:Uncharacterized protein n=1 Tax=Protopolystoma xenopodis TaxID=117903 RepID=A0A448X9X4_9PLAT|nr:unnamed protein product [Protopolystoma xenopodis]
MECAKKCTWIFCNIFCIYCFLFKDSSKDPIFSNLLCLRNVINNVSDVSELEPIVFLAPFLDVIRSPETTGPVTGLALTAADKFLAYGLLQVNSAGAPTYGPGSLHSVAIAAEEIADAVTQTRFMGTDRSSDEI